MEYNSIFKRYDIRGKYPSEVNENNARLLAKAYFDEVKPTEVVFGYDNILGSETVANSFATELSDLGCKVTSIGMVPTPVLYYAGTSLNLDHSLMFTASHLGEGHTGIKPDQFGLPLSERTILNIKEKYENLLKSEVSGSFFSESERKFEFNKVSIEQKYLSKIFSLVGDISLRYRMVVDAGNGPMNRLINDISERLGENFITINTDIRSSHLSHPSNPKIKENRDQLVQAIKEYQADFGIIWDGDCDRCLFVDNMGELIPAEFIALAITRSLYGRFKKGKITCDVRASSAIELECLALGIEVKRIKAWHVPIKEEMTKDVDIIFGFEVSGHYVFRDLYKIDDGLLAALSFLEGITKSRIDLHDSLSKFKAKYYIPEEMNYKTSVSEEMLQATLSEKYNDGRVNLIDGISVDYPTWRFNVRSSRTEPIVRLNISGYNKVEVLQRLVDVEREIGGVKI